MKSMTGYGRGEYDNGVIKMTVEIKAVNNRYCEVIIKQPRQYMALEDKIKKYIISNIERGRVEVFVNTKEISSENSEIKIDQERALAYDLVLRELTEKLHSQYNPDVYRLLSLPEVITHEDKEEDLDETWEMLQQALVEAMAQHQQMRITEGEAIKKDMYLKLATLEELVKKVTERSPLVTENYRTKLTNRINEILGENDVVQERLAQEVAYFGEKSCIDEELVRLQSHFKQFKTIAESSGGIGRKLDFLIQEMNRETNTIGSKANDLEITSLVVEMKSELEKLREQVQNIE